jgi:chromosomal replication initiation ATPase DnaA
LPDRTRQLAFDLPHRPALGYEDFLVAPSNEAAVAWLDAWPDWPGAGLAISGPPGCGKTHLAHVWRTRSGATLLTPEQLGDQEVPALIGGATALVLDPFEPPLPRGVEQQMLHLYNSIGERRGHLLLCTRTPPARWPVALADLASRLAALPAVTVTSPDERLIQAVLVKQFADRQLSVAPEVVAYVCSRIERSFAAAAQTVAALDRAALAARRKVTLALAREVLAEREGNL